MSKIITNQLTPQSGDTITVNGRLSVGGTVTYEDVTNVDSVGIVTAGGGVRIGTGGTVGPVGSGIVTYFGDGSQLTGIDATSLKDTDGTVRVQANTSGAVLTGVLTATSYKGDGSALTGIESWNQQDTWLYGG